MSQHQIYATEADVPFRKLKLLGRGANGQVEKVQHNLDPRKVYARKTFYVPPPIGKGKKNDKKDCIDQEVAFIKSLSSHKHMVELVETYTCGNEFAIIMLPVAEWNLAEWLVQAANDVFLDAQKNIVQWFACLACGFEYLHSLHIKHRDVKPENILVKLDDGKYKVLLTDFGIAKETFGVTITTASEQKGTKTYWPPEVDEWTRSGRRGDVFSLGIIFFEMLVLYSDLELGTEESDPPRFPNNRQGSYCKNLDKVTARLAELSKQIPNLSWFQTIIFLCEKMVQRDWRVRPFAECLVTCWKYPTVTDTPPTSCNCIQISDGVIPPREDREDGASSEFHLDSHNLARELQCDVLSRRLRDVALSETPDQDFDSVELGSSFGTDGSDRTAETSDAGSRSSSLSSQASQTSTPRKTPRKNRQRDWSPSLGEVKTRSGRKSVPTFKKKQLQQEHN